MTDEPEALSALRPRIDAVLTAEMEEAQQIIRKHGFVFRRDLSKVTGDSVEAANWEKLAFTFYSMLLPSAHRIETLALSALPAAAPALDVEQIAKSLKARYSALRNVSIPDLAMGLDIAVSDARLAAEERP